MGESLDGRPAALFRLEFGGSLGWGHLVRSGALAAELRRRGWRCDLWTRSSPASAPAALSQAFTRVLPLEGDDAQLPAGYAWVVVDHYATSDERLRAWRAQGRGRILAIDDEATRRLEAADLVLNARLGLEESPYPPHVRTLLGSSFALLRPELWQPIAPPWSVTPDVAPVLVTLGGTDPAGALGTVLEALAEVDPVGLAPIVVRPSGAPDSPAFAEVMCRFRHTTVLAAVSASEFAGWVGMCRFAVSAAGGTLYELAALGLPFVSVVVADNQRALSRAAQVHWGMPSVEFGGTDVRGELAGAIRDLMAHDRRADARLAGIDAHGAARVAQAMGA